MVNKYTSMPAGIKNAILTKDGRIINSLGKCLSRERLHGQYSYIVESMGRSKRYASEQPALLEFNAENVGNHVRGADGLGFGSEPGTEHPQVGYGKKNKKKKKKKENKGDISGIFSKIDSDTVDRSNLEQAMERKHMSVTELAELADVDPSTVSRNLRKPKSSSAGRDPGGRNPSITLAADLSSILGIPIETVFPDLFKKGKKRKKRKGNVKSGSKSHFKKKGHLEESINLLTDDLREIDHLISEGITSIIIARPDLHRMIIESLRDLPSNTCPSRIRSAIFDRINQKRSGIKPSTPGSLAESMQRNHYASKHANVESFRRLFLDHFVPCVGVLKTILSNGLKMINEESNMASASVESPASQIGGSVSTTSTGQPSSQSSAEVASNDLKQETTNPKEMFNDINKAEQDQKELDAKKKEEYLKTLEDLQVHAVETGEKLATDNKSMNQQNEKDEQSIAEIGNGIADMIDKFK